MMRAFDNQDLIAGIATPRGNAGVGIVRVSGRDSEIQEFSKKILGLVPQPRFARYLPFYDADKKVIDEGIALYFPAPHSFTGESVLELQAHGGAVILDCLLSFVLQIGARLANPGEFSLRAFVNGKIDLLQAEAICDLISAGTEAAARSASRSLQGDFSSRVNAIGDQLLLLRCYVEAAIDFSEEEIDFLGEGQVMEKLGAIEKSVFQLLNSAQQGVLLQQGATLAIVGEPNVGKSSLLNRLTARDVAIVTEIAGTTRDVLREQIQIDGLPIHLVDTAGLRETDDRIEQAGIARSWREVEHADCILFVWDLSTGNNPKESKILLEIIKRAGKKVPIIGVGNKSDRVVGNFRDNMGLDFPVVFLSAKMGDGVDKLREEIKSLVGFQSNMESPFMARRRHVSALEHVYHALLAAREPAEAALGDCLAQELRYAQDALSELTGQMTSDDLLGEIFSNFCIGK
jgi:tRNA modification GTPase